MHDAEAALTAELAGLLLVYVSGRHNYMPPADGPEGRPPFGNACVCSTCVRSRALLGLSDAVEGSDGS
jgi:hypothetical protein